MIHWRDEGAVHRRGINITAVSNRYGMSISLSIMFGNYRIARRWRSWADDIPWSFTKR